MRALHTSPRKPKTKPAYEVVSDREDRDDEFGYTQHTVVDDNGLFMAMETTAANRHDSHNLCWR
jgi:transposase, IS5 family